MDMYASCGIRMKNCRKGDALALETVALIKRFGGLKVTQDPSPRIETGARRLQRCRLLVDTDWRRANAGQRPASRRPHAAMYNPILEDN